MPPRGLGLGVGVGVASPFPLTAPFRLKSAALWCAVLGTLVISCATYDPVRHLPTTWAGAAAYAGVTTLAWADGRWRARRSALIVMASTALTAVVGAVFGLGALHAAWIGLANAVMITALQWVYRRWSSTQEWFPDGPAHVLLALVLCIVATVAAVGIGAVPYWWLGEAASAELTVGWLIRQATHLLFGLLTIFSLWFPPNPTYTRLDFTRYLLLFVPLGVFCQLVPFFLPSYPVHWMVFIPAILIGLTMTPRVMPVAAVFMAALPMLFRDSPLWSVSPGRFLSPTSIMECLFCAALCLSFVLVSFRERRARLTAKARAAAQSEAAQAEVLRSVVQTMTDGVLLTDALGNIVVSNPAARSMLGRSATSASTDGWIAHHGVRTSSGAVLTSEERRRLLDPPSDGGARMTISIPGENDGERHYFDVAARRLVHRTDRLNLVLLSDVTAAHARSRELESFAGTVAHDLKNPLAAVALWMDTAESELANDPRKGVRALAQARESSRRMGVMIDEYLAYTVTREGVLRPSAVDLSDVVHEVLDSDICREGELAPRVEVHIDGIVQADRTLLVQLITNLVGNAVKYARPGRGAHVVIRTESDAQPGWLRVFVEDDGVGFTAEEASRIFLPFTRTTTGAAHSQGIGLGLALCHAIVTRHGGHITAYPNERRGATFEFTLPRAEALVGLSSTGIEAHIR